MGKKQYWQPRCPSCGSYEVDFAPFSGGKEWKCEDCGMSFDQHEVDDNGDREVAW